MNSLEEEEVQVEYTVHKISPDDPDGKTKLKEAIEQECHNPKAPLGKSHVTSNPDVEIVLASEIYEELDKNYPLHCYLQIGIVQFIGRNDYNDLKILLEK